MTLDEICLYLEYQGISKQTLEVVTDINGYSMDTINDIVYAVSGYQTFKQYLYNNDYATFMEYYEEEADDYE